MSLSIAVDSMHPVFVMGNGQLMRPVSSLVLPSRKEPFSAATFYQNRNDLLVREPAAELLGCAVREVVETTPERSYVSFRLEACAFDWEIAAELPDECLSRLEDIASLIEAQPKGAPGFLVSEPITPNLFFVEGVNRQLLTATVSWLPEELGNRWGFGVFKFIVSNEDRPRVKDEGFWCRGVQFVCPGTLVKLPTNHNVADR